MQNQENVNQMAHSRPIRFRVWDTEYKEMCLVDKLQFMFEDDNKISASVFSDLKVGEEGTGEYTGEYIRDIFPEHLVLMQFTGLLDKNGKEIYEGDILGDDTEGWSYDFVEWSDIWCGWATHYWFGSKELAENADGLEVVGNIYENPELLAK